MAALDFPSDIPVCLPVPNGQALEECGGTMIINGVKQKFLLSDLKKNWKKVDSGSFGTIYKVIFNDTNVAVKEVQIVTDAKLKFNTKDRVEREVDISQKAASNCKYVVGFYGYTVVHDKSYMCMEFVECSLYHCILTWKYMPSKKAKYEFDEDVVGNVVVAVVDGLSYLKSCELVHRDIKPSNILITRKGCVKICDFGMVGVLVNSYALTSQTGTKSYLAPEKFKIESDASNSNPRYDVRADVWSLGITLAYACTGAHPYEKAKGDYDVYHMIVDGNPPILSLKNYSKMCNFVNSCLAKEVEQRPKLTGLMEKNFYKEHSNRREADEKKTAQFVEEVIKRKERGDFDKYK